MAAPELFNSVINNLMSRVTLNTWVWFGGYQLPDLEHVDDTALFAESVTDLPTALKIYSEETPGWSAEYPSHGPEPPSNDKDGTDV